MDEKIYEEMIHKLESLSDSSTSVSVKVKNAALTLKGTAGTRKIRDSIIEMANAIEGVSGVDCRLMIARQKRGGGAMTYILGLES